MNRYDTDRALGYRDERAWQPDPRRVADLSERAEDWFAQGLGLRGQGDLGHADPGWDVEWRGWRFDVKWAQDVPGQRGGKGPTEWCAYPGLRVPTWKARRADIFVLVIGQAVEDFEGWAWADGWATREEVEAAPQLAGLTRRTSGKPAPYHFIGFDYLRPLADILGLEPKR